MPADEFPLIALTSVTALGLLTGKLGQEMVERPPSDLVYFYKGFSSVIFIFAFLLFM